MRTYVRRRRKTSSSAVDHTEHRMTLPARAHGPSLAAMLALAAGAAAAGAVVVWVALASDHREPGVVWAVFGPLVGWSFIAAGVYAWRIRPAYRTRELMGLLGFAWFLFTLDGANDPAVYTFARILGGLWGGVFLHLGLSFPTGRLSERADRVLVLAGYLIFPLATVPLFLVAGPADAGCADCPESVLLLERDGALADVARVGGGGAVWWAAFIATALTPFAFVGGLLRSQVFQLDAELRARLEELRASRARLIHAGDEERRRLERDLHDGAQSRLLALALTLRTARRRAEGDPELADLLDAAQEELQPSLRELRELARGIHPAVLSQRGLAPALDGLAARAPVPVTLEACEAERLPAPVESAAYFVVSEALANVAKYSGATQATVRVDREPDRVTVLVADDGVGGADAGRRGPPPSTPPCAAPPLGPQRGRSWRDRGPGSGCARRWSRWIRLTS